jgi:hypothetical protein
MEAVHMYKICSHCGTSKTLAHPCRCMEEEVKMRTAIELRRHQYTNELLASLRFARTKCMASSHESRLAARVR